MHRLQPSHWEDRGVNTHRNDSGKGWGARVSHCMQACQGLFSHENKACRPAYCLVRVVQHLNTASSRNLHSLPIGNCQGLAQNRAK